MNYLVKKINDVHVTWLAQVNRYILFKEPAFRVFRLWMENKPQQEIIAEVVEKYHIPLPEAERFVDEVTSRIRAVTGGSNKKEEPVMQTGNPAIHQQTAHERIYAINGSTFRLCYGNDYIESVIHPRLQHLAARPGESGVEHTFRLSCSDGCYHLAAGNPVDGISSFAWIEELTGAVYLRLLNIIFGASTEDWMGVLHASAVTDGKVAVLFVAPSGSGKSTLSAILFVHGYHVLSDDFVPVMLSGPEICSFPGAISVKEGAQPLLAKYFPGMAPRGKPDGKGMKRIAGYIPPFEGDFRKLRVPAKAIVFLEYNPKVSLHIEPVPNTKVMNELLRESWIANNPVAAKRFIDWYFSLPCYSLTYSDNTKAVACVRSLFESRKNDAVS